MYRREVDDNTLLNIARVSRRHLGRSHNPQVVEADRTRRQTEGPPTAAILGRNMPKCRFNVLCTHAEKNRTKSIWYKKKAAVITPVLSVY